MPKKAKSKQKPQLVAAERMMEVEGGACPQTWNLAPWIFPPGSIADVSSMLADFSGTQIEQAIALIHAGHVVGFSASYAELPMMVPYDV